MKLNAVMALLLVSSFTLLPLPFDSDRGEYNTWTGMIWCTDHAACVHEVGHKLDQQAGWVSGSREYSYAIQLYMGAQLGAAADPANTLTYRVFDTFFVHPDPGRLRELYALMFEKADGIAARMPVDFQQFYDWKLARQLLQETVR